MKQLAEFIKNGSNFAVISHVSPDGDTMGSAAALLYALKKLGKRGQWFCEGNVPNDYLKIPEIKSLVECDKIKKFDSVIAVDVSSEDRMGSCLELFKRIERRAQIDHHVTNTMFASVNVVRDRNATSFIMLELFRELGVELDRSIARALFVSVCTDTGRLSHAGVTAQDVLDTAELYKLGIDHNEIIATLFQTSSLKKVKLKGRASERLEFDNGITYTWLDLTDYAEFDAESSDSEGVIEMCRSVEGTRIAFFIREIPEGYKVSMRSTPEYDVAEICSRFGGGGHKPAAGCTIKDTRENVISLLLEAIKEVL